MRTTRTLVEVALALMERPTDRHWGYALAHSSGVRSPVLYRILHRMLDEGWLEDGWEDQLDSRGRKAPPRRYYELTERGSRELGALLAHARLGEPRRDLAPRWT